MTKMPNHVAIIPDGNRRWAKLNNLPTLEGHRRGAKRFQDLARYARQKGIHTLTAWGFSTENWSRDQEEIHNLMDLFIWLIRQNESDAHRDQIRIRHLGRKDRLPRKLLEELQRIEEDTSKYERYDFNLCIDYGGQDEIIRAVKKLLKNEIFTSIRKQQNVEQTESAVSQPYHIAVNMLENILDQVNVDLFYKYLDTGDQKYPNPDLLIRTSGEMRTSGLMPFQMSYAELYFEPACLPDFTIDKLDLALESYSNRDRRFGGNTK